jgi:hypothetical protein
VVAASRPKKRPEALNELAALLETQTAGDPMSRQKWVRCSLRQLRHELAEQGHDVSHTTIRRWLKEQDYRLHSNRKELARKQHPDRDRQFRYIKRVRHLFGAAGHPIVSVDTKKKELIGNFQNKGRAWRRQAEAVNVHDFRQDALGRAVPYGIYDIQHNLGYVYVGTSADTPEFAVDALAHWWQLPHRPTFADESKLLILADGGGSNGYRPRLWKKALQESLADAFQIDVMVCHYPTGASKWNPIEHRLFSYISINWAAQPLHSFELMLRFIQDTTTATGLEVEAYLCEQEYRAGINVSDDEMAALHLHRRSICPSWNYIISHRGKS